MELTRGAIFEFAAPGPRLRDARLGRELQKAGKRGSGKAGRREARKRPDRKGSLILSEAKDLALEHWKLLSKSPRFSG
jgi:hypothetical protein